MQPIVKDTKKDPVRPAHEDTHEKVTGEQTTDERLNRTANEVAGRGLERQRKDDESHPPFSGVGGYYWIESDKIAYRKWPRFKPRPFCVSTRSCLRMQQVLCCLKHHLTAYVGDSLGKG